MSNLTMDLTGSLENYLVENEVFKISKYGQCVDFHTPIFKDSLVVTLITSGVNGIQLVVDEDFIIPEECVNSCDNDLSRAMLQDPDFNSTLISGIRITRAVEAGTTFTISCTYQRLYPAQLRTAYLHGEPLIVTPELIADMVNKIEQHDVFVNKVSSLTTDDSSSSILLEEDVDCTNANNEIIDEDHIVNTSGNRFLIHPKGGSFYKHSLVIKLASTGEVLTEGTDYRVIQMDAGATKASTYQGVGGIWKFILILRSINGHVLVSYHAFGGEPTLDNYRELQELYAAIIQYLSDSSMLTAETLGSTELMTSIFDRVNKLEAQVRRLQGTPSYGDLTDGKTIVMKLFAETQGLHWFTIAKLYKIDGDTTPCIADTFTFRLQTEQTHIQMTASVAVDLSNQKGDIMNVTMLNDNYPRGYVPFSDYSKIDRIIQPQLRVVWNEQDSVSGAYLQLGFELKNVLEETVQIEDISGHESCWLLVDEVATVTTPQDDDFALPDGSTWSTLLQKHRLESMMVPFRNGHLIWAGTVNMNDSTGWQYHEFADDLILDTSVDITKFKKLRVDVSETDGFQFPVDIQFNSGTDHLKGHASFTHNNEPVYINAEIFIVNNKIYVRLNWDVVAAVESNPLEIKDLVIFL